jgi:methyl-accepting chemotaxis protein
MFSRLSIRSKISATLVFLLLSLTGLGLLAISKMSTLRATTVDIQTRAG